MSLSTLERPRVRRGLKWGSVGAVGMAIDLAITLSLLGAVHVAAANAAGWAIAVTCNFVGNWLWTYQRPDGSLPRQYASYVGLHGLSLGARVAVVIGVATVGGGVTATAAGIAAAAVLNFVGNEAIFDGAGEIWFDAVDAANHAAHIVYNSRIRQLLQNTGLYDPIFRAYTLGVGVVYPGSKRAISVNGASAAVPTDSGLETVSVLHTLEKERDILECFVDDVGEDDVVLDVGANVGVFSALAADRGADVTAVEPHPPTANACRETLRHNDASGQVVEAALGDERGTVSLAVDQDGAGTQRPEISDSGEYEVRLCPGDQLGINPTVIKIDVEGAEVDTLRGLSDSLTAARVVFVEAHDCDAAAQCRGILESAGLAVETLHNGSETYLRGAVGGGFLSQQSGPKHNGETRMKND